LRINWRRGRSSMVVSSLQPAACSAQQLLQEPV
jgi:hypothetical protein